MNYQEVEFVLKHNKDLIASFHYDKNLICRFFRKHKAGHWEQLHKSDVKKLLAEAKKKERHPNFKL